MENNLRKLRLDKGYSQSVLANLAETNRQTIYEIEHGKRDPGTSLSLRLSKALDCSVEDIFLGSLSYKNYKGKQIT